MYLNANRVLESLQIQPSLSARVEITRRNPNLLGCHRVSDFLLKCHKLFRKKDLGFYGFYLAGLVLTLGIEYMFSLFVNLYLLLIDAGNSICTGQ